VFYGYHVTTTRNKKVTFINFKLKMVSNYHPPTNVKKSKSYARYSQEIKGNPDYNSSNLPPILDVLGRPLTAPVGSSQAEAQMQQASTIYKQEVSTQPSQEAKEQKIAQIRQAVAGKFSGRVQQEGGREEYYVRGRRTALIEQGELKQSEPSYFDFRKRTPTSTTSESAVFSKEGASFGSTQQTWEQPQEQVITSKNLFKPTKQDYISNPELRRELPVLERLKIAYTSTGGKVIQFPFIINPRGLFRAGVETIDIVTSPVIKKLKIPNPQMRTKFIEDVGISTFLLGISSPTTAQIERQLFSVSKVSVAGVTQRAGKGFVKTNALFTVERNNQFIKGAIKSQSQQKGSYVLTASKGKTFNKDILFPTGKQIIVPKSSFQVGEVAKVSQIKGYSVSKSVGMVKESFNKYVYKSVGVSFQKGKLIGQVGITQTSTNQIAVSQGVLKVARTSSKEFFVNPSGLSGNLQQITSSITTTTPSKVIALQSVKNAIGSAVQFPAKTITNIIPITSISAMQTPKTITSQSNQTVTQSILPKTTTTTKQSFIPKVNTIQNEGNKTIGRTKNIPTQMTNQDSIQKVIQKTNQITNTRQVNKTLLATRTIQTQRNIFRGGSFKIPLRNPTPKGFVLPFKLPSFKQKIPSGNLRLEVKQKGKWVTRGISPNLNKLTNLGKDITGKTINRSFRIKGVTASIPQGYRYSRKKGQKDVFVELSKTSISQRAEREALRKFK
jgi:hypothetical protein